MKRVPMLGGMLLLVLGAAGCAGNPRDEEISKAINYFDGAAAELKALKGTLKKAVAAVDKERAEGKRTDDKLTLKDLQPAIAEADKLRETGKKLVEVKGEIERLKDSTNKAEREELAKKHGQRLQEVFRQLDTAEAEWDTAVAALEPRAEPIALDALRKAFKTSREEFEGLTKQR